MKKFLLLFCTVVLVCSLMIVPASAAGVISSSESIEDVVLLPDRVAPGTYILTFSYDAQASRGTIVSEPFIVGDYSQVPDGDTLVDASITSEFVATLQEDPSVEASVYLEFFFAPEFDLGYSSVCYLYLNGSSFVFDDGVEFTFTLTPYVEQPDSESVLSGVFGVFGGVGSWIVGQLGTTTSLFWNGQSLTFLGVLSVCALALAVILLLVFVIVRFLRFRG